jgi:hypothetical protein
VYRVVSRRGVEFAPQEAEAARGSHPPKLTGAERTARQRRWLGVREGRFLRAFDETEDKDEQYCANGRHDDGAEQAPA